VLSLNPYFGRAKLPLCPNLGGAGPPSRACFLSKHPSAARPFGEDLRERSSESQRVIECRAGFGSAKIGRAGQFSDAFYSISSVLLCIPFLGYLNESSDILCVKDLKQSVNSDFAKESLRNNIYNMTQGFCRLARQPATRAVLILFGLDRGAHCHGVDARGDEGPDLHGVTKSDARIASLIKNGKKGEMPMFESKLSDSEVQALVAFVRSLKD
jgi:hypothetical protein